MGKKPCPRCQGSLWTAPNVSRLDLCKFAYGARCGSVISFCNCGLTLFLQGCLETLKKRMEQYQPLWLQGKRGLFHYFSASWDRWLQARLFDLVLTFKVGGFLFPCYISASSSLEWPLTGTFSLYKFHLLNAVLFSLPLSLSLSLSLFLCKRNVKVGFVFLFVFEANVSIWC